MTHPCLHYEFNEAWVYSDLGDVAPELAGGSLENYAERYPKGRVRVTWSARTCRNGRYLLEGTETSYYENGQKEHEVAYMHGRKSGQESFWAPDGMLIWTWSHDTEKNMSTWVHYWSNGQKRIESNWTTQLRARDLDRKFFGLVADGPTSHWKEDGSLAATYSFKDGNLSGGLPLSTANK